MKFTGRDLESISPVNQFLQVELPRGWQANPKLLLDSELDCWLRAQKQHILIEKQITEQGEERGYATLEKLALMHTWAVPLLRAMARHEVPTMALLLQLDNFTRWLTNMRPETREWKVSVPGQSPRKLSDFTEGDVLPPEAKLEVVSMEKQVALIIYSVFSTVATVVYKREVIKMCPMCSNAFIPFSSKSSTCSLRCGNRLRVRRYKEHRREQGLPKI